MDSRRSTPMKRRGLSPKRYKSMDNVRVINSVEENIDFLSRTLEEFHYRQDVGGVLRRRSTSESSIDVCFIYDSESSKHSDSEEETATILPSPDASEDSGIEKNVHPDALLVIEQKIDKLSDIFLDQSQQLSALREEIARTNEAVEAAIDAHGQAVTNALASILADNFPVPLISALLEDSGPEDQRGGDSTCSSAQALLDALDTTRNRANALDNIIGKALAEFLQSEELRRQIVTSTLKSVKSLIRGCYREDLTAKCLPVLQRSHRRLLRHVTTTLEDAFRNIEEHALDYSNTTGRASRQLRAALERHQRLVAARGRGDAAAEVAATVQLVLKEEIKKWRETVSGLIPVPPPPSPSSLLMSQDELQLVPTSPPQPAGSGKSAMEQLMEINIKLNDGDVNGSFEKALSAADLSLVMAACKSADPALIFATPCQLEQHVLLSLIQQLATDMVHDSQLKCRYIEDALMNLNPYNPATRTHLPTVIKEVCFHLSSFLFKFPHHMLKRRIEMLILAAGSLMKTVDVLNLMAAKRNC